MKPSPAGEILIVREQIQRAAAERMKAKYPNGLSVKDIVAECRELYELSKVQYHEGRVSWEHLENIRRQLEKVEASAARRHETQEEAE